MQVMDTTLACAARATSRNARDRLRAYCNSPRTVVCPVLVSVLAAAAARGDCAVPKRQVRSSARASDRCHGAWRFPGIKQPLIPVGASQIEVPSIPFSSPPSNRIAFSFRPVQYAGAGRAVRKSIWSFLGDLRQSVQADPRCYTCVQGIDARSNGDSHTCIRPIAYCSRNARKLRTDHEDGWWWMTVLPTTSALSARIVDGCRIWTRIGGKNMQGRTRGAQVTE